ncbi:MAG: response regulator [Desulfobacterales bacterium]|jgi:signal transduction histidine kinase/ActR/RegA family two-component response regulator
MTMNQVADIRMDAEKLLARIDYLEENRRFIQNALEMALSLGDFQENINKGYGPEHILKEADKRISHLIAFKANALYLVDEENSNFHLSVCSKNNSESFVQAEVDHMIEQGYFAWAIREKRGILISSRDHSRKFVLHVIATYARIRGMFVGLLPEKNSKTPDTSLTLLSIILLNTANALESLEFYSLLRNQNEILEQMVEERTQTLAKYERQLQQVLKIQAIGTLAGGIAHDFNNILFPIVGYTELTMEEVPEDSVAHNNLEEIIKATNRAKDLVTQILAFSRQSGQERKPVEIQQVTKEALKLLRASIPASIEIVHDIDENCSPVMGDASQIHQVIINLCTNAYQAMQDTGGKLEVSLKEIYVEYEHTVQKIGMQPGRHVQLQVKDEGCGMDVSVLDRIFEPYYTTKEQGKGTGLGLSVIHGIIKNHRGDITAKSSPGSGALFTVLLPVAEEGDVQTEYEPVNGVEKGSERILLVDDEEQIISMERQMLENLGYKVTARTNSVEALKEFSEQPNQYDLVITDMTMPHMNGDELAQKLLNVKPDIPVILCTGFNEDITEEKALEMGIQKFIMKPVLKNDLATTIRSLLVHHPAN